jgi:hypothetical protein
MSLSRSEFEAKDAIDEARFLFRAYGMGDPKTMTRNAKRLRLLVRLEMRKTIREIRCKEPAFLTATEATTGAGSSRAKRRACP